MKSFKSIITLVLAVCMAVGAMPVSFAEVGEFSGITVTYDFTPDTDMSIIGASTNLTNVPTMEDTNGFWGFSASNGTYTSGLNAKNDYGMLMHTGGSRAVAFRIHVPKAGKYTVKMRHVRATNGCVGNMYILDKDVADADVIDALETLTPFKQIDFAATADEIANAKELGDRYSGYWIYINSNCSALPFETETLGIYDFESAGNYIVAFNRGSGTTSLSTAYIGDIILDGGDGAAVIGSITSGADALTAGESTTVTASGYNSATTEAAALSYESSDTSVAAVNASTGAVTAVGAGTADILATADGITVPLKTSITVSDAAATPTADVLVTAANASSGGSAVSANITASGTDSLVKGMRAAQNVGTKITVTADAEADGATFKYWQNHTTKKVVSSERSFEFTVGSNVMLVAVYSKAPEAGKYAVDFLNANGAVIQSTYVNSGATIGSITKPATPTMTGYTFTGWNAEDAEVIDGDTYVMAEYEPAGITASISVNGTSNSYAFNAEVEATSDDADFSYWTRNGKIISYSPTYKFYAWKDAEVTAVCNGAVTKTPRVLLDGAPIGTAVMMEYEVPTGFTKVEAGIIYGGSNVTLANYTSKAISGSDAAHGQFTALANTENYARAYLIYSDGTNNYVLYSDTVAIV